MLKISDGSFVDDASTTITVVNAAADSILQPNAERLTDVYLRSYSGKPAATASEHSCHPHKLWELLSC